MSTVRRWSARQGMSRLPPLDPPPPMQRYEHATPGDLLHLDIKKLGRIVRPGHRVTGNPRDGVAVGAIAGQPFAGRALENSAIGSGLIQAPAGDAKRSLFCPGRMHVITAKTGIQLL